MSESKGRAFAHSEGSQDESLAVLRNYWGHSDFRPGQWDVIGAILSDRDVKPLIRERMETIVAEGNPKVAFS